MENVGLPIETDDQQWERYRDKMEAITPMYASSITDAASHDWRAFIDWLHDQDGHNCDRDFILRFLDKPWKWQTEWERFTKEQESR